ncbi:pentapeptide repeat-containing protein [Bradyrhizobium ottawaense]|nr:pentapeptide repeat-containing protein [Bradyrhizobium ottawaense]MBR1332787.1 pentapeptide repeat-containing protein [Bradyrhizobium ottawaense]
MRCPTRRSRRPAETICDLQDCDLQDCDLQDCDLQDCMRRPCWAWPRS